MLQALVDRIAKIGRVSSKGQITIPAEIRRKAGIGANDSVEFAQEDHLIVITKVQPLNQVWLTAQSATMTEWSSTDEDVYNKLA
jgi:AbrB family looped-hinge helix DNA binding protein